MKPANYEYNDKINFAFARDLKLNDDILML